MKQPRRTLDVKKNLQKKTLILVIASTHTNIIYCNILPFPVHFEVYYAVHYACISEMQKCFKIVEKWYSIKYQDIVVVLVSIDGCI